MSRPLLYVLIAVTAFMMLATSLTAGFLAGRGYFQINRRHSTFATPVPVVVQTPVPAAQPSPSPVPTETAIPLPTTEPDTETGVPTATVVPPTPVSVTNTAVKYVMALTDVNIRGGPGTQYVILGWVAEGQLAQVTGMNLDNSWWRVVCPNGAIDSCWVTAHRQYTQPAGAPVSRPTATPTAAACSNSAAFVADVTIPDGMQIAPNTGFNKTWRIQNTGTCTWDNRYQLAHHAGSFLDAITSSIPLPRNVAPGQIIDLTVSLVSPAAAGSYQSDWLLQTPQGQPLGMGRRGSPLWVKINVVPDHKQSSSITGFLWADYCLTNENGDALDGSCVVDGSGRNHADGMIEPTEGYVAGITILLQAGRCANNSAVPKTAVTDENGRYFFGGLGPDTYCISINAAAPENAPWLLPGDWTFPGRGIQYQEITLSGTDHAYPVNFGWDYHLK